MGKLLSLETSKHRRGKGKTTSGKKEASARERDKGRDDFRILFSIQFAGEWKNERSRSL